MKKWVPKTLDATSLEKLGIKVAEFLNRINAQPSEVIKAGEEITRMRADWYSVTLVVHTELESL